MGNSVACGMVAVRGGSAHEVFSFAVFYMIDEGNWIATIPEVAFEASNLSCQHTSY